jgi:adenosylmethionine-8-amino-7-oxononanoate aminotransferase
VALRNIRILQEEDFPYQAATKGEYLLQGLQTALGDHPHVGEVRGKGLMCAVEIVKDKSTKEEFAPSENIGAKINNATQQRGLFSRARGDVYCLAPPIVTTHSQLGRIVDILRDSIKAVLG